MFPTEGRIDTGNFVGLLLIAHGNDQYIAVINQ